jgi:nitroreductase
VLSVGYPADAEDLTRPPRAGGRRPLAEILHRERW